MDTRPGRLPEALERTLAARGFRVLTPVQRAVLDAGARGADLLVSAPTGSARPSPSAWRWRIIWPRRTARLGRW
jgi:hypothetical protein